VSAPRLAKESLFQKSEPIVAEEDIVTDDERWGTENAALGGDLCVLREALAIFRLVGGLEDGLSVQARRVAPAPSRGCRRCRSVPS
jgi:hypothetical protein